MTILLAITALAFCALLWASVSIDRHLRRAAGLHNRKSSSPREMIRHPR